MKQEYKHLEKLDLREIHEEQSQKFEKISCPSCSTHISADNLNLQNKIGKCNNCDVIFSLDKEVEKLKSNNIVKQHVLRPAGIDLFSFKDDLEITIQRSVSGFDAFAAGFLSLMTLVFFIAHFDGGNVSIFIPVGLFIAFVYYLYKCFNHSKNKTYLEVNKKELNIKSVPNTFSKDESYVSENIDQVYIRKSATMGGYYDVNLLINDSSGQIHKKLLHINSLSKAQYLEQEIEKHLGIKDRKVMEEDI